MTHPSLDDADRARIRAEEMERAKVREELAAEKRLRERPSYWGGALLNLLVSGAGLMFLGRVGMGLAWLLGTIGLALAASPLIAWPVGAVGSFYHYDVVYGSLYARPEDKAREDAAGRTTVKLLALIGFLIALTWLLIQLR